MHIKYVIKSNGVSTLMQPHLIAIHLPKKWQQHDNNKIKYISLMIQTYLIAASILLLATISSIIYDGDA